MYSKELDELCIYLAHLFNKKLALPDTSTLEEIISNNLTKTNSHWIKEAFIEFVDQVQQNFLDILQESSNPHTTFLNDEELSEDNEDACMTFFSMILNESYSPSAVDTSLLMSRIFLIVRHESVTAPRIVEIMQLLNLAKFICNKINTVPPSPYMPSYDEHSCDCFEYQMSGDCSHSLDDVFS